MASALLGKCVGILTLVLLLFYGCCYAFRIREHAGQTVPVSLEPSQRATCDSIFGRCQERTPAVGAGGRKWQHDSTPASSRLASARKPPVEVTSTDDDDDTGTEGTRSRHGRTGRSRDPVADDSAARDTASESVQDQDEDDEDDEVIVEVEEEDTDVNVASDGGVAEDSDDYEDERDGDNDDEDEREEDVEDKEEPRKRVQRSKQRSVEEEDDERSDKDTHRKAFKKDDTRDRTTRIAKGAKRAVHHEEEEVGDSKRKASLVKDSMQKSVEKEEKTEIEDDDDDDEEVDEDEDEDDEEIEVQPVTTPPPRKLEKVRHADKDKVRSSEAATVASVQEKPKSRAKESSEVTTKKPEEVVKKSVEQAKKPVDGPKISAESPTKSSEAAKKVEPAKSTKSETESSKLKVTARSDEKSKAPVKTELPKATAKTQEQAKQSAQRKVKTPGVQPVPTNTAEIKGADKDESKKAKTKTRTQPPFTLAHLNDAILRVPTFVPNFTGIEDFECQQHGKIFLRQLRGYKLWALQMLDSSAKVPSGLLRGNVNQLGDFDECLGIMAHVKLDDKTIKVQGKYCLANIDLYPAHPNMKLPVNMMQARAFIRASMHDPGHFVPKFTTVNWALCLPAACSAEDAQSVLEQALSDYNSTVGIKFVVDVDPNMCYVKQKLRTYSKETIGVLYFYAMIVCLVTVATVRDYLVVSEGKGNYSERIIMSFSLRRTVASLLKRQSNEADITCIHGIRALATIVLYIAHQLIPIARLPFANRIELTEVANTPVSSVLRVSMLYTDCFLLLSGVLTAYNMSHEFIVRGEIRWFCRFIARYIRLTPALLAVVFWYAFVMEHTGSGPQWNSIILPNAELCKSNAWTNLLYIQNFFPFEEMCATHTHQLALDMQLSLLAPMLVFLLEFKPIVGIILIFFFVLLSATLRYVATMNNYLSLVIFHGMSLKHLYRTANLAYALPLHRATPYVFGVTLGVLLRYTGKDVRIHKVLVILGWLIAMALGSWSLFSPWLLARRDYVYDAEEATHYAVISPVVWALASCWLIFACYTNHGGLLNRFLSSHWLAIFSRISYAIYLTQFMVFFYNVGTTRYSTEFQLTRIIDPMEATIVLAVSTVVTLLFDLPMQEIKNVVMESTDILSAEVAATEKPTPVTENDENKSMKPDETQLKKVFEEEEVSSTGWDWQRDIVDGGVKYNEEMLDDEEQIHVPVLTKSTGRRRSFIVHDPSETVETIPAWERTKESNKRLSKNEMDDDDQYRRRERGRSRSGQRDYPRAENDAFELSRMQQEREEAIKRGRRSLSRSLDAKRLSTRGNEDDDEYSRRRDEYGDEYEQEEEEEEEAEDEIEEDRRRYSRSESRGRSLIRESDDYRSWEFVGKERSSSRGPDSKRLFSKSEEREPPLRQTRPPPAYSRSSETRRTFSSGSEDEQLSTQRQGRIEKRHSRSVSEPRISDEEDWESELRIRRKQFMERLATSQQRDSCPDEEEDLNSLRRRSSAEGKIALLKDPSANDNMDSWTISVGSRVAQLGSSQERSEPEDDSVYSRRREYRERGPPLRENVQTEQEEEVAREGARRRSNTSSGQLTSMEEDEDVSAYNFVLTKDSRRISLQDLSNLPQDDSELADSGWNMVKNNDSSEATMPRTTSTGLYKRESIVKSQASEEDPEYLLPERPKLVQQEREHPFKKAWQMQKSRSEEDAYVIKEAKESSRIETRSTRDDAPRVKSESSGEQYEDTGSFADDESESISLARSKSTDTDDNTRTSSRSEETESASTAQRTDGSTSHEANKGNSRSSDADEDSLRFNWPSEEEQTEFCKSGPRSKSEEVEWSWGQEET